MCGIIKRKSASCSVNIGTGSVKSALDKQIIQYKVKKEKNAHRGNDKRQTGRNLN